MTLCAEAFIMWWEKRKLALQWKWMKDLNRQSIGEENTNGF